MIKETTGHIRTVYLPGSSSSPKDIPQPQTRSPRYIRTVGLSTSVIITLKTSTSIGDSRHLSIRSLRGKSYPPPPTMAEWDDEQAVDWRARRAASLIEWTVIGHGPHSVRYRAAFQADYRVWHAQLNGESVVGISTVHLPIIVLGKPSTLVLRGVLHMPNSPYPAFFSLHTQFGEDIHAQSNPHHSQMSTRDTHPLCILRYNLDKMGWVLQTAR
jgi:hypothetical protein